MDTETIKSISSFLELFRGIGSPVFWFAVYLVSIFADSYTGGRLHTKIGKYSSKELKGGVSRDERFYILIPIALYAVSMLARALKEPSFTVDVFYLGSTAFSFLATYANTGSILANITLITNKNIPAPFMKFFNVEAELKNKTKREGIEEKEEKENNELTK